LKTVGAAFIDAGAAIYATNVWSTTKREPAPGKSLEQEIKQLKETTG
jgi:methionine synthase I (cobalamin-dependent)